MIGRTEDGGGGKVEANVDFNSGTVVVVYDRIPAWKYIKKEWTDGYMRSTHYVG